MGEGGPWYETFSRAASLDFLFCLLNAPLETTAYGHMQPPAAGGLPIRALPVLRWEAGEKSRPTTRSLPGMALPATRLARAFYSTLLLAIASPTTLDTSMFYWLLGKSCDLKSPRNKNGLL